MPTYMDLFFFFFFFWYHHLHTYLLLNYCLAALFFSSSYSSSSSCVCLRRPFRDWWFNPQCSQSSRRREREDSHSLLHIYLWHHTYVHIMYSSPSPIQIPQSMWPLSLHDFLRYEVTVRLEQHLASWSSEEELGFLRGHFHLHFLDNDGEPGCLCFCLVFLEISGWLEKLSKDSMITTWILLSLRSRRIRTGAGRLRPWQFATADNRRRLLVGIRTQQVQG